MRDHLIEVAAHFGVGGLRFPERMPNTRRALALSELARDEGKLDDYRDVAMNGYWREGLDLENDEHLRLIVSRAGMPDDSLQRIESDRRFLNRVDSIRDEAASIGVSAIPTFVIGGLGVVGCQPYEVLEQLMARAGVTPR